MLHHHARPCSQLCMVSGAIARENGRRLKLFHKYHVSEGEPGAQVKARQLSGRTLVQDWEQVLASLLRTASTAAAVTTPAACTSSLIAESTCRRCTLVEDSPRTENRPSQSRVLVRVWVIVPRMCVLSDHVRSNAGPHLEMLSGSQQRVQSWILRGSGIMHHALQATWPTEHIALSPVSALQRCMTPMHGTSKGWTAAGGSAKLCVT